MTSSIMMMSTILTWTMLSMNNSMNLSLTIMMMTVLFTTLIGMNISSWYAMILFLICIGGMMVMFSYFVSLTSNDSMMTKSKIHFMIIIPIISTKIYAQESTPMFLSSQINNLYMSKNMIILLLITMILLLMMVIVIKSVKKMMDPYVGLANTLNIKMAE